MKAGPDAVRNRELLDEVYNVARTIEIPKEVRVKGRDGEE